MAKPMTMANQTHAVITDKTPSRCTVQFVGSVDECYEFQGNDSDGDGTQGILEIDQRKIPAVGERAYWLDGIVWSANS